MGPVRALSAPLALEHGPVGLLEEETQIRHDSGGPVASPEGDPDAELATLAGLDVCRLGVEGHGLGVLTHDGLEGLGVHVREDRVELVAAEAGEESPVLLRDDTSATRQFLDELITHVVSVGVVEGLEVVRVEEEQARAPAPTTLLLDAQPRLARERALVHDAREIVGVDLDLQIAHLFAQALDLNIAPAQDVLQLAIERGQALVLQLGGGRVHQERDGSHERLRARDEDRRDREHAKHRIPLARTDIHRLLADRLPRRHPSTDGRADGLVVDVEEELGGAPAGEIRLGEPEQSLGRRIRVHDRSVVERRDRREGQRLEEALGELGLAFVEDHASRVE